MPSNTLYLEVADTPSKCQRGLMFVKNMQSNRGMMFKFKNAIKLSFWGANTYIPLDIAFITDNKIESIKHIKPMDMSYVSSNSKCDCAIQANLGFFKKHNIKPGFECVFGQDQNSNFVTFKQVKNELV